MSWRTVVLKSRRLKLVICITASLWFMAAGAAEDAAVCTNLPSSDLKVLVFHREARMVSVGLEDLRLLTEEARVSAMLRQTHPLTFTMAKLSAQADVDHRAAEVARSTFCAAPRSVRVGIGFPERIIYIADAAVAQPCIQQELLDHDEKHARVDDEALIAFLARIEEPLTQTLATLKRQPAPSAQVAAERFEAGLQAFLDAALAAFDEERARLHSLVDSVEEIERLHNACGGGVRRLEDAPSGSERRI
ncbi:MAG: hypothetical protein ACLGJC_29210 [Alphaproteobacteria bacterium]